MSVTSTSQHKVARAVGSSQPQNADRPSSFVEVCGLRVNNTDLVSAAEQIIEAAVSETPS